MTKIVVAVGFLALNGYVFYFMGADDRIPERKSFSAFPQEIGEWRCPAPAEIPSKIEHRLGVTDYLVCAFRREKAPRPVSVYVGYHERQVREGAKSFAESSIHPPKHCLPGSGWQIMDARVVTRDLPGLPGGPQEVNRLIVVKGNQRQLVYYWYQSRGRVIARDWMKIVSLFWDRATRQRSDGSLVRFTVPIGDQDVEEADAAFRDFASRFLPRLPAYVPN